MNFRQGRFNPKNPQKYIGDIKDIIYRSSWELRCMMRFDSDSDVIAWSSESLAIPYSDKDGGLHRYFPDFLLKKRNRETGKIDTVIVEVKPFHESPMHSRPVQGNKTRKRFLRECETWAKNATKWEAAIRLCKRKGWKFLVLTEKELGLPYKKPGTK